jgi:hypothetical protein
MPGHSAGHRLNAIDGENRESAVTMNWLCSFRDHELLCAHGRLHAAEVLPQGEATEGIELSPLQSGREKDAASHRSRRLPRKRKTILLSPSQLLTQMTESHLNDLESDAIEAY